MLEAMQLHAAILRHLDARPIEDQGELLSLLRSEGFELTLSTLSRHLKKLGVRKELGVYRPVEGATAGLPPCTLHKVPGCLLVLKTQPGFAGAVALALDSAKLVHMAGSVAGDDTIFIAPTDLTRLDALERDVRTWLSRQS